MIIDTSAEEPLLFKGGDFAHTDIVLNRPLILPSSSTCIIR
jgi:hypothetical protein